MKTLVTIWSALKTFFSAQNIKTIIILAFLTLAGFSIYQHYKIRELKGQVAAANEQQSINDRNAAVLKDSIHYWKAKDSSSVATTSLLSATNATWGTQFSDLNNRFNNLILNYNKKVQRQTYLETQIAVKDSIIAQISTRDTSSGSYVANDSTIKIDQVNQYDSRNYSSLTGTIKEHIDSNRILGAHLQLQQTFGIGVDLATYRDAKGVPQVSVATKYPGAKLTVSGIQDVNDQIEAAISKTKVKSSFGIGIQAGYGYLVAPGMPVKTGIYVGIGVGWQPNFLRFNKK